MKKNSALKVLVNVKNFQCNICNKSGFSTSYKLKAHLFLHKAVPARHKCSYCSKEFFRTDEYSRHLATHRKIQKLHYCDHCGRGFVDKRNLILHLNVHDDLPMFAKLRYECIACGVNYCEERLLKYHIRKAHLNLNVSKPAYETKSLNETWIEDVKGTKSCVQITKTKPNTLTIKSCNVKYKRETKNDGQKDAFEQYMASVFAMKDTHYSKAICDYCGKQMLKKSILGHIRERHLKLWRFRCDVCKRGFMRHYQLCSHLCGQERRHRKKVVKPLELKTDKEKGAS